MRPIAAIAKQVRVIMEPLVQQTFARRQRARKETVVQAADAPLHAAQPRGVRA
jgi:hypothetical protein